MEKKTITDKDWLDLAWKYFQQCAQQRLLYFNYFVIFSTIITTALVTTFQNNFQVPYLGICLGIIQIFLSFIFWKIDSRNKFLTKYAEKVIRTIEKEYESSGYNTYNFFSEEEKITTELKKKDKHKLFFFRRFSHGESYRVIFITFLFVGLIGIFITSVNIINKYNERDKKITLEYLLKKNDNKVEYLKSTVLFHDSILRIYVDKNKTIIRKLDSLERITKRN